MKTNNIIYYNADSNFTKLFTDREFKKASTVNPEVYRLFFAQLKNGGDCAFAAPNGRNIMLRKLFLDDSVFRFSANLINNIQDDGNVEFETLATCKIKIGPTKIFSYKGNCLASVEEIFSVEGVSSEVPAFLVSKEIGMAKHSINMEWMPVFENITNVLLGLAIYFLDYKK